MKETKTKKLNLDGFFPLLKKKSFMLSRVLRVPAVFARDDLMASSSIDLRRGPQIKPEDKRPGRPQPSTGAPVPGRIRPHSGTRMEKVNVGGGTHKEPGEYRLLLLLLLFPALV